ncbi:DNA-binding response regulator, NarL/FixJ family, contains REC and HTH domains [Filimonas lacunae]|uniref:DNA-binding response regulator, NarL/FixJ family, contains REC and HTH domains n=1 Tax=Filimonas lacunae TaxID=477680 RepID=A0A1N7NBC3_9BACT|nr:response regulator [Filimonas lacunae]SIS95558.1 DNA-binding response regulator, NarL/FixJ family, contains REC and HTH domains [Filimonas lacunae]
MIKKVLIAEDHEIVNISVQKTLEDLNITDVQYAAYCDEALLKIQRELQRNQSYDLLITDLYFEKDHIPQQLSGGEDLIAAARQVQPDLKILVFSAENKPAVIEKLHGHDIDGYVRKARNDSRELKQALETIGKNLRYFPRQLMQGVKQMNAHDFTSYDIIIITLLSQGIRQKDMPECLKEKKITPSGLSSIEKRLNTIKESLGVGNNEQLVAFCKDNGII